ncbi:FadR family transcriptional regulator [Gordonia sp. zg691]|uniref:FadR/GntR family transcriptional regulator n=1 Tax=Gordonia jinghuaiqii TaxID=2758710 RepID=UPI0016625316|nr:GntR family transcriptional regulator [Gordonia jinghuaiqii]MBD0860486.1 FadR family transcriptional regulator [Gordonia jinghuaiqii]
MEPTRVGGVRPRFSQPSIAEMVAEELRERIISGALREGDMLPPQEELIREFQVSRPPLREALRILEAEGLIAVRRGNVGGAVVHAPSKSGTAYSLGLLLQFEQVSLGDLAGAIAEIEPVCVRHAAELPDRGKTLIPRLRTLVALQETLVDDESEFTRTGREFHDAVIEGCGNDTLRLVAGALAGLWSSQEEEWADAVAASDRYPAPALRAEVVKTHRRLIDAIEAGDADAAAELSRSHARASQQHILGMQDAAAADAARAVSLSKQVTITRGRMFNDRRTSV